MNPGLGVFNSNDAFARLRGLGWRAPALCVLVALTSVAVSSANGLPSDHPSFAVATGSLPPAVEYAPPESLVQPLPGDEDTGAKRFKGRVGANLTDSLKAAGVPDAQGRDYVGVLARAIPLAEGISVEDMFDVVVERKADGSFGALLYVGLDRVARADVTLLRWTDGRKVEWINSDGVGGGTESAGMGRPVDGRVTSNFGMRFHPLLHHSRFHKGMDVGAPAGSPIVAAADGRIAAAGWHGGYGQQVAIAHADGLKTTYSHMSRIAARPGEIVRRGQVIGYVGSTGLSTGPHLHFEVLRNGRAIDPRVAKVAGGPGQLQGAQLHAFRNRLRSLLLLRG